MQITDQVARALNAAQQHSLVHRDIKPANLMLVREDDELAVKVIDFGLARTIVPEGEDAVTMSMGGFVGTPHFASPEQLEEKDVDVRTDIYSLGVTLWYMLAGRAPFAVRWRSDSRGLEAAAIRAIHQSQGARRAAAADAGKDPRNRPQARRRRGRRSTRAAGRSADSPAAAGSVAGRRKILRRF